MAVAELLERDPTDPVAFVIGFLGPFVFTLAAMPVAINRLVAAGVVGRDRHKPGMPAVAEMGGIIVFLAFTLGALAMIVLLGLEGGEFTVMLAALLVGASMAVVGAWDDIFGLRQQVKAALPFGFAIPLAAVAENTSIWLPGLGDTEFGASYIFLLVPIGIACASNGYNMLEGFNGLGASLGTITAAALAMITVIRGETVGLVVLLPLAGALAGFLGFNLHPARVFPGDTMTLMVGAMLAVGAILAKVEFFGAILFLLFIVEFVIKASHGFPTAGWGGILQADGRLVSAKRSPVGLAQVVMKITGGVAERSLVAILSGTQAVLAIGVVCWAWVAP